MTTHISAFAYYWILRFPNDSFAFFAFFSDQDLMKHSARNEYVQVSVQYVQSTSVSRFSKPTSAVYPNPVSATTVTSIEAANSVHVKD